METKFYKWWKGHRRVVTFGGFLILFAWYLSPVIQEAKYKNRCINITEKALIYQLKDMSLRETNLSIKEIAAMEAYKNCNANPKNGVWGK